MRGGLLVFILVTGCKIDILGDPEPDRCPGTDLDYCVPPGEAAICFTGLSGGVALVGLEWDFDGAGVSSNDGCAYVDGFTSTLRVTAGGISRSFELELVEPS